MLERLLLKSLDASAAGDLVTQYRTAFLEAAAGDKEQDFALNQLLFIENVASKLAGGSRSPAIDAIRLMREQLTTPAEAAPGATAVEPSDSGSKAPARARRKPHARKPATKRKRPAAHRSARGE